MAFSPITGQAVQYSTEDNELASGYYIKLYDAGTTNPYSMGTDATPTDRLAKAKLNASGYPISNPLDDTTVFVPHVDQNYRMVLYKTEADADADNTAAAEWNVDNLRPDAAIQQDASDITLRDVTLEQQDDYDRSPLFVDGTDFTAGLGPHVITVPAGWTANDASMRYYKLDSSGNVTILTPTSSDATTFTLGETLLSTDVIYIGDDSFRNIFDGDPSDIRTRLNVYSQSETYTQSEVDSGFQANPTAVTNFVGAGNYYLHDNAIQSGSFNIASNIGASFESVGPTGSGATNIWTALDSLPSDAKYVRILVSLSFTSNAQTLARQQSGFRSVGGAALPASQAVHEFGVSSGNATRGNYSTTIDVPLDGSLRFEMNYNPNLSGGASEACFMYVVGFGT